MTHVRSFFRFWYDFIVGDDWRLALAAVGRTRIVRTGGGSVDPRMVGGAGRRCRLPRAGRAARSDLKGLRRASTCTPGSDVTLKRHHLADGAWPFAAFDVAGDNGSRTRQRAGNHREGNPSDLSRQRPSCPSSRRVPGRGSWTRCTSRGPRRRTGPRPSAPFQRGVAEFTRYYGMLLDTMRDGVRQRLRVPRVGSGRRRRRSRERFARAEEVWAKKLWRDQLREWDEVGEAGRDRDRTGSFRRSIPTRSPTPTWSRTSRGAATTTPQMISQHMRYTGAAMLSVGDLLAHVGDWTECPAVGGARG